MPRFRIVMVPRGSWEAVVEAPDLERAREVVAEEFDMVTRATDAEWDEESSEVTTDPPEFVWDDKDGDDD